MEVTKIVYSIIGITVGVIVIATVLLPTLEDATASGEPGEAYATLLGVVATLSIIAVVMMAVRLMGGRQ